MTAVIAPLRQKRLLKKRPRESILSNGVTCRGATSMAGPIAAAPSNSVTRVIP
jgi:hypothetical protein